MPHGVYLLDRRVTSCITKERMKPGESPSQNLVVTVLYGKVGFLAKNSVRFEFGLSLGAM
jgi:hypothetical protein